METNVWLLIKTIINSHFKKSNYLLLKQDEGEAPSKYRRESIRMVLNSCKIILHFYSKFPVSFFIATSEFGSKEEFRRTNGNQCIIINDIIFFSLFKILMIWKSGRRRRCKLHMRRSEWKRFIDLLRWLLELVPRQVRRSHSSLGWRAGFYRLRLGLFAVRRQTVADEPSLQTRQGDDWICPTVGSTFA